MSRIEETPFSELFDLNGKSAIVTGGAAGIGYAISRRLAQAGAQVLLTDINLGAGKKAARLLRDEGYEVKAKGTDVTVEAEVKAMVNYAEENMGGVDILINNAGIFPRANIFEMSTEKWDDVINVNLRGTFLCCREVALQMVARNEGGVIICLSSINALRPNLLEFGHYDASKGGVISFMRNLALQLAPYKIRVISVAPGGIWTDGIKSMALESGDANEKEFLEAFEAKVPLRRMGHPDDVARVVLFLASEAAAYMTGTTVVVDGGAILT